MHGPGGGHHHGHDDEGHTHGAIDPSIVASKKGLKAVKWSAVIMLATAALQAVVVAFSGSVSLLADTIHNVADASTAVPLGIAFMLCRLPATKRFTYGYGRVEDFSGVAIVFIILLSALAAGYETVMRFLHPQPMTHLWAVSAAAIVGFAGNEIVAALRIKVGKEIHSAALIADGYHARTDGLTSLAVLGGVAGSVMGYPVADPLIGLLITVVIFGIVWDSAKTVIVRALDGVEPEIIDDVRKTAALTQGVSHVTNVRARWVGHRLHAEVNVTVDGKLSVEHGHDIAKDVQRRLYGEHNYLSMAVVHVDPATESGEHHHPRP